MVIALGLGYTAPALAGAGLAAVGFVVLAVAVALARREESRRVELPGTGAETAVS